MSDATGVGGFYDLVRKERAEAEKNNVIETKIETKPAEAEAKVEPTADAVTE